MAAGLVPANEELTWSQVLLLDPAALVVFSFTQKSNHIYLNI